MREDADALLEKLGIRSRDTTPAPSRTNEGQTSTGHSRRTPALTVVTLQTTSIPCKESVTYNKETQTAAGGSERECELFYPIF